MRNFTIRHLITPHFFSQSAHYLSYCLPFLLLLSRTTADLGLVVVDILFLAKCYYHKEWDWLKATWVKCCLLFSAYLILINAPLSIQPLSSLSYALFFLRWPLFAVALSEWLIKSEQYMRQSLIALGIVISFIVLDTWYQYFIGHDVFGYTLCCDHRLTGPFNKPLVGIMLVRVLFLLLFATLVFDFLKSTPKNLIFTLTILLIGLLTIFICGERMAFILGFSGFITILLGYWMQYKAMRLRILLGLILLFVLVGLVCILKPTLTERMIHNATEKLLHFANSDYGMVFNAAWRAWKEHWLFGSGLHTYKLNCESLNLLNNTGMFCSHPHNLYLQIGTETGLIGLILFIAMIIAIYVHALKRPIHERNWLKTALAFTILSMSFWPFIGGISLMNNWVAAITWFGVGWIFSTMQTKSNHQYLSQK